MASQQAYGTTICMSVDYDAVSIWIAAGQTGLRTLSRGECAAYATSHLLEIFKRHGITTSWYIPGATALYPASVAQVGAGGHEIANRTLRHEDIGALSVDQMRHSLSRTNDILEHITGQRPLGPRLSGADLGDGMRVAPVSRSWPSSDSAMTRACSVPPLPRRA